MIKINILHKELCHRYDDWVQIAIESSVLRNLGTVIRELNEGNGYADVGYEISSYLIEDIPNALLDVTDMFNIIKTKSISQIKVFYRDTLIREYKNEDTEVKCYFEKGEPVLTDETYRKTAIDEALKEIITGDGECPRYLSRWWVPAGIQRNANVTGGILKNNISLVTARTNIGKTIFFDTENSLDPEALEVAYTK